MVLSEPEWYDQLKADRRPLFEGDPESFTSLIWLLHTIDFHLARNLIAPEILKDPSRKVLYSVNPKGNAGFLMQTVNHAFPGSQHVFMYRDILKVVESFGSIFSSINFTSKLLGLLDSKIGGPAFRPPRMSADSFHSIALREAFSKLRLPEHPMVKGLGLMWVDAMLSWVEFRQSQDGGREENMSSTLTLRMNEFVTKDLQKRKKVVDQLLSFAGLDTTDKELHERAMEVFGTHSQAGSMMAKSSAVTKKKFLSPEDEKVLTQICSNFPVLLPPAVLEGSIGYRS